MVCRIKKKLLLGNFTIEHKLKVPKSLKGDFKINIKQKKDSSGDSGLEKSCPSPILIFGASALLRINSQQSCWRWLETGGRQLWVMEKNYLFHKKLGDYVWRNPKICSTSCQRLSITSGSVHYQVNVNISHNLSSWLQEEAHLRKGLTHLHSEEQYKETSRGFIFHCMLTTMSYGKP